MPIHRKGTLRIQVGLLIDGRMIVPCKTPIDVPRNRTPEQLSSQLADMFQLHTPSQPYNSQIDDLSLKNVFNLGIIEDDVKDNLKGYPYRICLYIRSRPVPDVKVQCIPHNPQHLHLVFRAVQPL